MAEGTSSAIDSAADMQTTSPPNDEISRAGPSAPSEFLTHLPSSIHKPFADAEPPPTEEPAEPTSISGSGVQLDLHGRTLNPRSCVTCRKRKVKCDKVHPCSNCIRNHIECVFPAPGRAPRKARKVTDGRDKELLERLRRLEGVVKGMGVEVPIEEKSRIRDAGSSRASVEPKSQDTQMDGSDDLAASATWEDIDHKDKTKWVEERQDRTFENRFGRLVVDEGKSRYINNSFWANLSNEVEDLKGILNPASDDDEPELEPNETQNKDHEGWVFGFNSQNVDLLSLHPQPAQIAEYWTIYKDRVDPLVKVLHIPSIEPTVLSAASRLSNLSKGFEALLFAIYYGATTSLNPADCMQKFGEDKNVLLARYRFAIQQALARANFLTTEEVIILQAFVVFLICLRRNNDARVIWTLTGLVVRIAQTIGVHRDGSHFGLAPFEVEMRRRLWWQVCILDSRASEDHGCDPTIIEQAFDTKMPLNINDTDITPDSKEFPPERQGCTDMSFCLIRFEVANTFRRINYIPPGPPKACTEYFANVTLEDKEQWITECHNRLEERYLKHCDMSVPLFWVTATVARLMMSKMWLMVYHPFQRHDGGASLPKETKEKLFITSLENIEYSLLLETESRTMKWGWLFKTYMQWHALAFILSELCQRTTGDLIERAWIAVEKTRDGRWGMHVTKDSRAGHLWRPLKKLYRKAKEARERGLKEEALKNQRALQTQRTYSPKPKTTLEQSQRQTAPTSSPTLSQAPRSNNSASYGQMPADKHEMFTSPISSNGAVSGNASPVHVSASREASEVQQSVPQNGMGNEYMTYSRPAPVMTSPTSFDSSPQMHNGPQFGHQFFVNTNANSLGGTNNISFSPISNNDMNLAQPISTPDTPTAPVMGNNTLTMNAYKSNNNSNNWDQNDMVMSAMDTSGDMNWQNWDQLVKQFGMDVVPGPGSGGPSNWGGSNWDMLMGNGNMRMNMGGDWF